MQTSVNRRLLTPFVLIVPKPVNALRSRITSFDQPIKRCVFHPGGPAVDRASMICISYELPGTSLRVSCHREAINRFVGIVGTPVIVTEDGTAVKTTFTINTTSGPAESSNKRRSFHCGGLKRTEQQQ